MTLKQEKKRPAVAIPYFDKHLSVRGIKYRLIGECPDGSRYTAEKGSQAGWYYLPEHLGYGRKLLIVEGEINLLSLAQVLPCDLDLLSSGSEAMSERMRQDLEKLSRRYQRVFVWFDRAEVAKEIAKIVRGKAIRSPVIDGVKHDANTLLVADTLHQFTRRVIWRRVSGMVTFRLAGKTRRWGKWLELDGQSFKLEVSNERK